MVVWAISFRFTSSSIAAAASSFDMVLPSHTRRSYLIILNPYIWALEIGEHAVGNGFIEFYFPPIATHFFDSGNYIVFDMIFVRLSIFHLKYIFSLGRSHPSDHSEYTVCTHIGYGIVNAWNTGCH